MSSRHVQAAVVLASLVLLLAVSGCVEEDAPPAPTTTASTPVPTATPAMAAVESPSPDAPLRAVSPGDIKYGPCEHGHAPPERHQHFLHWTPDGTHLVFDEGNTVWTLDIENGRLRTIARIYSGDYVPPDGFYADVSPDGSRVVYSTCEFGLFELPPHLEGYAGEGVLRDSRGECGWHRPETADGDRAFRRLSGLVSRWDPRGLRGDHKYIGPDIRTQHSPCAIAL